MGRYTVRRELGRGVFSSVFLCHDEQSDRNVAVKAMRALEESQEIFKEETEILRKIEGGSPSHCISVIEAFHDETTGSDFIVTELMEMNLRTFMEEKMSKMSSSKRAEIVNLLLKQMSQALERLKGKKIIHADLKPDNIFLTEEPLVFKLGDFGSSISMNDENVAPAFNYRVSRFYRAPEVILGNQVGRGIDIWALGYTLFEIYTGDVLFDGEDNNEMIEKMIRTLGKIPSTIIEKGGLASLEHFSKKGNDYVFRKKLGRQPDSLSRGIRERIAEKTEKDIPDNREERNATKEMSRNIALFVETCTTLDPLSREKKFEAAMEKN